MAWSGSPEPASYSNGFTKTRLSCTHPDFHRYACYNTLYISWYDNSLSPHGAFQSTELLRISIHIYQLGYINKFTSTPFIGLCSTRPLSSRTQHRLPRSCHFWRAPPTSAGITPNNERDSHSIPHPSHNTCLLTVRVPWDKSWQPPKRIPNIHNASE